jgi:ABC-type multidrug transport system fused ATPase/permease subunit
MAFEEIKENVEDIQEQAEAYIESNLAYFKLRTFKMAMKSTTMVLKFSVILLGFSMVLLFCSFALAFAIANYLGSYPFGFLIVGGFYLIATGLLYLVRDKVLEGTLLERFSEIFFND